MAYSATDYQELIPKQFQDQGVILTEESKTIDLGKPNLIWLKNYWEQLADETKAAKTHEEIKFNRACKELKTSHSPARDIELQTIILARARKICKNDEKHAQCLQKVALLAELLEKNVPQKAPLFFKRPTFRTGERIHIFTSTEFPEAATLVDEANLNNFIAAKITRLADGKITAKLKEHRNGWRKIAHLSVNHPCIIKNTEASYLAKNCHKILRPYLAARNNIEPEVLNDLVLWMSEALTNTDER